MHVKQTTAGLLACLIVSLGIGCDHTPRHAFCEAIEAPVAVPMEDSKVFLSDEDSYASPRNFSWVIDEQLAGMAHPGYGAGLLGSYGYLAANEVTLMVSLTESAPVSDGLDAHGISHIHLPVVDFTAPTLEQLDAFVTTTASELTHGGRVVVHCGAGQGRTGTFLAAWFVASGATSDEAIDHVRQLRPGSIETTEQLEIVAEYADTLH